MTKPTGGPAFPQANDRVVASLSIEKSQGMTLRDYFAIHSLTVCNVNGKEQKASWAYQMADAMLKAREQ